jgi:PIN domain nuclease of toxin-antitoxin system
VQVAEDFDGPLPLDHATHVGSLPPHHGDPFDRMLVSQAIVEGLTLVTADRALARYEVDMLQVRVRPPGTRVRLM